jgi:hypothetical protein
MDLPFCIKSILEPRSLKRGVLVYTPERTWMAAVPKLVHGPTYYVGKHPPHNTTAVASVADVPAAAVVIVDNSPLPDLPHTLGLIVVKTSPFFEPPEEFERTLRALRRNDGLSNARPLVELMQGYVFYDDYQLPARVFDRADLNTLAQNVKNVAVVSCKHKKRMAAFFLAQGFTPRLSGYAKGDTTVHVVKKGDHVPMNGVRQFHNVAPSTPEDLHKELACFMHVGSHDHLPPTERNIHVFTYAQNSQRFAAWDVSSLIKRVAPPFLSPTPPVLVEFHTLANGERVTDVDDAHDAHDAHDAELSGVQYEDRSYATVLAGLFFDRPAYTLSQLLKEARRRKHPFSYVAARNAALSLVGTVVELPDGELGVVALDDNTYSVQVFDAELQQAVSTLNKHYKSVFDGTSEPNWAGAAHHFFKKNNWWSAPAVMEHYVDALPPEQRELVVHLTLTESKAGYADLWGLNKNGALVLHINGVAHEALNLKKKHLSSVARYLNDGQISVFSENAPQLCVEIEILLRAKDHDDFLRCWFERPQI